MRPYIFLLLLFPHISMACETDVPHCKKVIITKVMHHPAIPNVRPKCVMRLLELPQKSVWYAWGAGENCEGMELNKELDVLLGQNCYPEKRAWQKTPDADYSTTEIFEDSHDIIWFKPRSYPAVSRDLESVTPKECKPILEEALRD